MDFRLFSFNIIGYVDYKTKALIGLSITCQGRPRYTIRLPVRSKSRLIAPIQVSSLSSTIGLIGTIIEIHANSYVARRRIYFKCGRYHVTMLFNKNGI